MSPSRAEHGGTKMRVGIATDHGGLELKQELTARLRAAGHDVVDFGAGALDPNDDYPDFVVPLARAVAAGRLAAEYSDASRHLRRIAKVESLELEATRASR
jgi:ribose 5-phosphate isomerase RpiB